MTNKTVEQKEAGSLQKRPKLKIGIEDLRAHLFEVIEEIKDPESNMDLDRAKTIANVAQVIVNAQKGEFDYQREFGVIGSGFIPLTDEEVRRLKAREF